MIKKCSEACCCLALNPKLRLWVLLDVPGLKIGCWNMNLLKKFIWQRGCEGSGAFCRFGSDWCEVLCSASWSPWEPWLRAAKSASTNHMEKNTYWPLQILLSDVLLLSHKLLRNGFRWRKVHFHLRIQCDWWLIWMCKKKKKRQPGYSWLLSCWACRMGPMALG